MNYSLYANTLIMAVAGLMFIFFPSFLVLSEDDYAKIMGQSFGVACLSYSLMSGLVFTLKDYLHAKQLGFACLYFFHFGTFFIQLIAFLDGFLPVFIPLIHLFFAITFVSFTFKYYR
jgi:hypothetical protein